MNLKFGLLTSLKTPLERRIRATVAAGVAICGIAAAEGAEPTCFDGLCGAELKAKVRETSRPGALLKRATGDGGVWDVINEVDRRPDGTPLDRFSHATFAEVDPTLHVPDGLTLTNVVSDQWWESWSLDSENVRYDLYNVVGCNAAVPALKGSLGPAELTDEVEEHDEGQWATGLRRLEGWQFPENTFYRFYRPPTGYEGDFARVVFYMMAVYPSDIDLATDARLHCDGTEYPGLVSWAVRQLLLWHEADPPSELERRRNDRFSAVQGNRNPFVDHPLLASHIWGELSAAPFGMVSGDVDGPAEPQRLKPRYSLETDEVVWLSTPRVAEDATWTVDGRPVTDNSVNVRELGLGTHCLRYRTTTASGKILIIIQP